MSRGSPAQLEASRQAEENWAATPHLDAQVKWSSLLQSLRKFHLHLPDHPSLAPRYQGSHGATKRARIRM